MPNPLNVAVIMGRSCNSPKPILGGAGGLFDDQGHFVNEGAQKFLPKFMAAFETWIV